jgi:hypothetical protein
MFKRGRMNEVKGILSIRGRINKVKGILSIRGRINKVKGILSIKCILGKSKIKLFIFDLCSQLKHFSEGCRWYKIMSSVMLPILLETRTAAYNLPDLF